MVYRVDEEEWYTTEELLDYNDIEDYQNIKSNKEETITIDDFKANTKEWLLDKLQSMSKENTLQTISNLYHEIHKPKYPTTYAECCDVLLISPYYNLRYHTYERNYYGFATSNTLISLEDKLNTLGKLIICRDAYWKIAGEKMGLGKPWKPNEDSITTQYGIRPLLFPSKEIYNMFYDNFKDLIEQCEELL